MADITIYPDLQYFQWERPDAETPRLQSGIDADDTTLTVTNPPLDEDGLIVSKAFLMGIKNKKGYTETIYVPANAVQGYGNAPDATNLGLTITGVTRGINIAGLDFTTEEAGLAVAHNNDEPVFCNISALIFAGMRGVYTGTVASGGTTWKMGLGTDVNITVEAYNGDANSPAWRYNASSNVWEFSNNGVDYTPFGTGAGVTAGDGIATIVAGVISIDLASSSPGLEFSSGNLQLKRDVIQNSAWSYAASSAGSDTYAITLTPAISAYAAGQSFILNADVTNTGACTLNVNGLGAKSIKLPSGSDPSDGDIIVGVNHLIYDGTNFVLQSPSANGSISTIDTPLNYFNSSRVSAEDRFSSTAITSSGSVDDRGMSLHLQTGTTSGATARTECNLFGQDNPDMSSRNPKWFARLSLSSTADQDGIWGLENGSGSSVSNGSFTGDHAAFILEDDKIYASVADGTTQSKSSDIVAAQSLTITNENEYYIAPSGSNYAFYVNGTLVHTSSSNNPDSNLVRATILIKNATTANKELDFSQHSLSIDE